MKGEHEVTEDHCKIKEAYNYAKTFNIFFIQSLKLNCY